MENTRYEILLVEDDKLDQVAFIRMVKDRELPYDCSVVASVAEAREILACKEFDVIVCDYALGDGTALDVLDSVGTAPVILVTGVGDEEVAVMAWRAGAYDYLVKDAERNYLKTVPITVENAVRHKKMKSKLQLLSHAVVSTEDSVYITDMDDKITFVNRAFCETYGYSEEEVIGKDCNMLWKQANGQDSYQAVNGWEVGFYHRRKDGSEFPVSLSRSGIKDENGNETAIVAIARDISERMRVENQMRALNRELEKQNRCKSELALKVSQELSESLDDLNNIISGVKKAVHSSDEARVNEKLESAEKDIARMFRAITHFHDTSKIEANKTQVKTASVTLE